MISPTGYESLVAIYFELERSKIIVDLYCNIIYSCELPIVISTYTWSHEGNFIKVDLEK